MVFPVQFRQLSKQKPELKHRHFSGVILQQLLQQRGQWFRVPKNDLRRGGRGFRIFVCRYNQHAMDEIHLSDRCNRPNAGLCSEQ